jgi:hypothetical protein
MSDARRPKSIRIRLSLWRQFHYVHYTRGSGVLNLSGYRGITAVRSIDARVQTNINAFTRSHLAVSVTKTFPRSLPHAVLELLGLVIIGAHVLAAKHPVAAAGNGNER